MKRKIERKGKKKEIKMLKGIYSESQIQKEINEIGKFDCVIPAFKRLSIIYEKRNDIPKLLWAADKELLGKVDQQNISVHRWFAPKGCPGDYLYGQLAYVADEVNKSLGGSAAAPAVSPKPTMVSEAPPYRVKVDADVLH